MAAGRRVSPDGSGGGESAIHGVAFDAKVISVGFPSVDEIIGEILPENPTSEQIRDLPEKLRNIESVVEMQFASAFDRLNSRVTAVNCSFGLPGSIENFSAEELRDGDFAVKQIRAWGARRRADPEVVELAVQADPGLAETSGGLPRCGPNCTRRPATRCPLRRSCAPSTA